MRMRVEDVKIYMNECGAAGTPFLFVVDFDMKEGMFVSNPTEQAEILFHTPLGGNRSMKRTDKIYSEKRMSVNPISYSEYKKKFDVVMRGLKRGDSYLTNLTVRTPVQTNIDMKDIFLFSNSSYGIYVPECFVCFSPERFVSITNGLISTNPMKGTISANVTDAEKIILSDMKEMAEHCTIVDLLRNDIGMSANDVRVERFRYIDHIKSCMGDILQVSSEITGNLTDDYLSRLGDIIFSMLPAGSVCGAPKKATLDIIHWAESHTRGYYTGVFGYFDGKEFDSAVMIRFIEYSQQELFFHSGGGITVYSDPEKEYDEMIKKIYLPFV